MNKLKNTTIIGVSRDGVAAMGSDGQVTLKDTIMKERAQKVQSLHDGEVLVGFAGGVADALTLFTRFEGKLDSYPGNLSKAVVELAKEWRKDKFLRKLEAFLTIMNTEESFILSGAGDIIKPDDKVVAVGSGAGYALAAARALLEYSNLDAPSIVEESIKMASRVCVYTNDNITVEVLDGEK